MLILTGCYTSVFGTTYHVDFFLEAMLVINKRLVLKIFNLTLVTDLYFYINDKIFSENIVISNNEFILETITDKQMYRVFQKTWEFSDEFDIVFSDNSLI